MLELAVLLVIAPAALAQSEGPAPRVGLVTMDPGLEYWARFGHNAILIDDGLGQTLYNYGYFDFSQPGFMLRFVRGRMQYRLLAMPLQEDLAGYAADGRGVTLQWLSVRPDKARELSEFLRWNARPENAEYRYDYFTDNCSTKVRDGLDLALDGALKRALQGRSHGWTYRDESRRLAASPLWLYLGIHLGLGPFTDKPLSLWDESFVPMRLHDAIHELHDADGKPVVVEEVRLAPSRLPLPAAVPPSWRSAFVLTGLALGLLLAYFLRPAAGVFARRAGAIFVGVLWTVFGFVGLGLIALWVGTDHSAAWANENALLFNPLCLALLPACGAMARGHAVKPMARRIAWAVLICAGAALFLKFLPFGFQSNGDWIALMLPIHAALAWRLTQEHRT